MLQHFILNRTYSLYVYLSCISDVINVMQLSPRFLLSPLAGFQYFVLCGTKYWPPRPTEVQGCLLRDPRNFIFSRKHSNTHPLLWLLQTTEAEITLLIAVFTVTPLQAETTRKRYLHSKLWTKNQRQRKQRT